MRDEVDGLIKSVAAEVEYLPDLQATWEEMDAHQRFAAWYDLRDVVIGDLLAALERRHQAGELSDEHTSFRWYKTNPTALPCPTYRGRYAADDMDESLAGEQVALLLFGQTSNGGSRRRNR